jgi:hypothetical protein
MAILEWFRARRSCGDIIIIVTVPIHFAVAKCRWHSFSSGRSESEERYTEETRGVFKAGFEQLHNMKNEKHSVTAMLLYINVNINRKQEIIL